MARAASASTALDPILLDEFCREVAALSGAASHRSLEEAIMRLRALSEIERELDTDDLLNLAANLSSAHGRGT